MAFAGEPGEVGLKLGLVERTLGRDGGVEGEAGIDGLGLKCNGEGRNPGDGDDPVVFVESYILLRNAEVAESVRSILGLTCVLELSGALAEVDENFVANGTLG